MGKSYKGLLEIRVDTFNLCESQGLCIEISKKHLKTHLDSYTHIIIMLNCLYTRVGTLSCNALCQYGNISEHLINNSNLTSLWKGAMLFSPCTTNNRLVSCYHCVIYIRILSMSSYY